MSGSQSCSQKLKQDCLSIQSKYCDDDDPEDVAVIMAEYDKSMCSTCIKKDIAECPGVEDEGVTFLFGSKMINLLSTSDYKRLTESVQSIEQASDAYREKNDPKTFVAATWKAFSDIESLFTSKRIMIHSMEKLCNLLYDAYDPIFAEKYAEIVNARNELKEKQMREVLLEDMQKNDAIRPPCLFGKLDTERNPWFPNDVNYSNDWEQWQPVSPLQLAWDTYFLKKAVDPEDFSMLFYGIPNVCSSGSLIHLFVRFGATLNEALEMQKGGGKRGTRRPRRQSTRRSHRRSTRRSRRRSTRRRSTRRRSTRRSPRRRSTRRLRRHSRKSKRRSHY